MKYIGKDSSPQMALKYCIFFFVFLLGECNYNIYNIHGNWIFLKPTQ